MLPTLLTATENLSSFSFVILVGISVFQLRTFNCLLLDSCPFLRLGFFLMKYAIIIIRPNEAKINPMHMNSCNWFVDTSGSGAEVSLSTRDFVRGRGTSIGIGGAFANWKFKFSASVDMTSGELESELCFTGGYALTAPLLERRNKDETRLQVSSINY
jgi:hypothetical protein